MKKMLVITAVGTFATLAAGPSNQYYNPQSYPTAGSPNYQNTQSGYNYGGQQGYYQGQQPGYQGQQQYQQPGYQGQQQYQQPGYQGQQNYYQGQPQYQQPNYPGQQYNPNQQFSDMGQPQNNQNQQPNDSSRQPGGYNDKSFYQLTHRDDQNKDDQLDNKSNEQPRSGTEKIALGSYTSANSTQNPADVQLSKKVHEVLYGWLSSGNQNIAFEVDNGKVVLTGTVNSLAEKDKIEKEVKKINGVTQVDNKITVLEPKKVAYYKPQKTSYSSTQAAVAEQKTRDYAALDSDKKLNAQIRDKLDKQLFDSVVIITANGVVTLAGSVENAQDFQNTVKDIEQLEGVKKVNNKVSEKKQ